MQLGFQRLWHLGSYTQHVTTSESQTKVLWLSVYKMSQDECLKIKPILG